MSRNDDLPSPASPYGTSMMNSGNTSLPALQGLDSTSSSLVCPSTPRDVEGLPIAPIMMTDRYRDLRRRNMNNYEDEDDENDGDDHDHEDNNNDSEGGYSHEQSIENHHHMRRQHRPFRATPILECPMDFLQCRKRFAVFEVSAWIAHSLEHFGSNVQPPGNSRCIFCWTVFDSPSGMASWNDKMVCAFYHHRDHGLRIRDAPYPDFALHQYMWEQGILSKAEWKHLSELKAATARRGRPGPSTSPPMSPSSEHDQDRMVMMTNTNRERRRERDERERRRLEQMEATERIQE